MKFLRNQLDKVKHQFEKGGKLEKYFYAYEAMDTFLFAPNTTNEVKGSQIRDAIDLKRLMMTVIIAMVPCLLFGIYNVGHQHFLAIGDAGATLGQKIGVGLWQVLPIVVVSYAVGLGIEFVFAIIRKHPVNEGFLVTGMLIPLVMPPDIPLWQVGVATAFAVIIGKEAFGGTGMNVVNVALTARAFLYFAYPTDISGDVWTYLGDAQVVAGFSGATPLSVAGDASTNGNNVIAALNSFGTGWNEGVFTLQNMFLGFRPGSIGETSTLMCLIGGLILIATGTGSWKIMVSVFGGAYAMGLLLNLVGSTPYTQLPAYYHLVIGGLAFGAVFMATDPVTAAQTETGKWVYGLLIGMFTVLIRNFNPAYPEGIMLAILFMNVFAPLIDYVVVSANKKRRLQRATV
ncbi:MAG TPA: NADH:ubiquinone reductase (Na(+)-transporting) subunit B [Cyclobacteriaceae bacterium]|jgi:Na+-transporting NADH:ubiquinone oxidoreductase subunit B|nr:NADH:ubiquinone reductase (Na(+)-transporting) subunit B [Cytophagales bacterium]HNT51054.1 NADH:ubiquinone reductase (Na(+)-transporting) subunit B [Cyclobacteriaceae bacterium]